MAKRHLFDHEQLEVYKLGLQFVAWCARLFDEMEGSRARIRQIVDHLDRGSLSALLNTAEGNGKRQQQVRARFFDDARGSATECAACLDALVARGACPEERVTEGKEMLVRIVQMLTKLVQRFSATGLVREEEADYS